MEQREVIEAGTDRPQRIIAGAGTGKTMTMVWRFAWLVEHGLDPLRIMAVTFSKAAAGELRSRITDELLRRQLISSSADLDGAWIGTFHALAHRLLRESPYETGFDRDIDVLESLEQALLVEEVKRSLLDGEIAGAATLELEAISPERALTLSSHIFPLIMRVRGLGLQPKEIEDICAAKAGHLANGASNASLEHMEADLAAEREAATLFCATYREYATRLENRKLTDFDGILMMARDALAGNPGFAREVRERYQYIIVDEFQDTNRLQMQLLGLLVRDGCGNLAVVGDPRQSIYGWRDADVTNILNFPASVAGWRNPGPADDLKPAIDQLLLENYRSDQVILDGAFQFVRHEQGFDNTNLRSTRRSHGPSALELFSATTNEEEACFIAGRIQELERAGTRLAAMAILTRTAHPPIALEQELRRRNIPYLTSTGSGFFERQEAKDALAYLRAIADPLDDEALIRVLQGPIVRLPDAEMYALRQIVSRDAAGFKHGLTTWDMVLDSEARGFPELSAEPATRLAQALALIREGMARKGEAGLGELLQMVLDRSGYATWAESSGAEAVRRRANLRQLVRMAADFESRHIFSGLDDFIRYVQLHAEMDIDVAEAGVADLQAVRMMTIHKAKGLEFPIVFLAHVRPFRSSEREQVAFDPSWGFILKYRDDAVGASRKTQKYAQWEGRATTLNKLAAEEIMRITYVAMTRAEKRLLVTAVRPKQEEWGEILKAPEGGVQEEHDLFRRLALYVADDPARGVLVNHSTEPPASGSRDQARARAVLPVEPRLPVNAWADTSPGVVEGPGGNQPLMLSVSTLEIFEQCPLRYRYRVEWDLPAPSDELGPAEVGDEGGSSTATIFGTLVHRVLERAHQLPRFPGPEELHTCWMVAAPDLISQPGAEKLWRARGRELFERYTRLEPAEYETLETEAEFNLVLVVDGAEVVIRGFIDRICRGPDGRLYLLDYKTGGIQARMGAYQRQLSLYQLAATEVLGLDAEPLLVDLQSGTIIRVEGERQRAAVEEVRAVIRAVLSGVREAPGKPPCWACAYRVSCPSSTVGQAMGDGL
ncbi:MAG TPA: ATP-dependent DNA helicase [Chloroflexota bacterium]|nr:ATP-dependent DNA helicase [Chloroflexota bacterium]